MGLKFLLGVFFLLSLLGAFVLAPSPKLSRKNGIGDISNDKDWSRHRRRLRLMTWNIGNGDLEAETRAHVEDLPAVAHAITNNDADAVAIQELTGENQLKLLLAHLENRYRGYICSPGSADRVNAVLVKNISGDAGSGSRHNFKADRAAPFNDVPAGDRFAAAAAFRLHNDFPEIVLVSAHADAFRPPVAARLLLKWWTGPAVDPGVRLCLSRETSIWKSASEIRPAFSLMTPSTTANRMRMF